VPVTLDAVGTVQALNTVTVRSQVDGRLVELAFREGQDVKRGDLLARIDPAVYQAQYDQAVAKKAQDEANLANARIDLQRYAALASTNAGSRQQADTQKALVAQLQALVQADQAAIDNARTYLEYTTIRSPLDGRLGIRLVDQGNLIRASDATGLVVITQLKPIALIFNLPQQHLRAVTAAMAAGSVPVEALEADNVTLLDRGRLEVIDNQVDQQTGTVKLKAVFPNERLQLWPGAFVNVRITTEVLRQVVVVPTGAVQRGPTGPFVYTVEGDKAVLKPVTITRQTEEITVLASGIKPPERVVTTGFGRLTDGQAVTVAEADASAGPRRRAPPQDAAAQPADATSPPPAARPEGRPARERPFRSREGRADAPEPRRVGPAADGGPPPSGPRPEAPTGTGSPRP
jgi:multidrug efflux system membrane fusion protein